jgi:hypothetical protein
VVNKCACADVAHPEALLTNWLPIPLSPLASAYQELGSGVVLDTQTCLRWRLPTLQAIPARRGSSTSAEGTARFSLSTTMFMFAASGETS